MLAVPCLRDGRFGQAASLVPDFQTRPPFGVPPQERLTGVLWTEVVQGNAVERLRRTALIAAWATQGAIRREDAQALAAYERRGRAPHLFLDLASASEEHAKAAVRFRCLPISVQRHLLANSAPQTAEQVLAALAAAESMDSVKPGGQPSVGRMDSLAQRLRPPGWAAAVVLAEAAREANHAIAQITHRKRMESLILEAEGVSNGNSDERGGGRDALSEDATLSGESSVISHTTRSSV